MIITQEQSIAELGGSGGQEAGGVAEDEWGDVLHHII